MQAKVYELEGFILRSDQFSSRMMYLFFLKIMIDVEWKRTRKEVGLLVVGSNDQRLKLRYATVHSNSVVFRNVNISHQTLDQRKRDLMAHVGTHRLESRDVAGQKNNAVI